MRRCRCSLLIRSTGPSIDLLFRHDPRGRFWSRKGSGRSIRHRITASMLNIQLPFRFRCQGAGTPPFSSFCVGDLHEGAYRRVLRKWRRATHRAILEAILLLLGSKCRLDLFFRATCPGSLPSIVQTDRHVRSRAGIAATLVRIDVWSVDERLCRCRRA